jgi:hypothetical protein
VKGPNKAIILYRQNNIKTYTSFWVALYLIDIVRETTGIPAWMKAGTFLLKTKIALNITLTSTWFFTKAPKLKLPLGTKHLLLNLRSSWNYTDGNPNAVFNS